ncbi:MAG: HEPN domain-containing protein, partial [Aquificota bacterium]
LDLFMKEKDYADVIREAQEIVELVQKAMLIRSGITPPKWHDVIDIILENSHRFPEDLIKTLRELRALTKWLRSQREIAFYGQPDFIPTEDYTEEDAREAYQLASRYIQLYHKLL